MCLLLRLLLLGEHVLVVMGWCGKDNEIALIEFFFR